MPEPFPVMLREWQNFYLLAGGAAATLIGLMFVALSLASRTLIDQTRSAFRTWVDPTLVHFAYVLATALLLVVPVVTTTVLGVSFILASAISNWRSLDLLYRAWLHHRDDRRIERVGRITFGLDDWLWRVALPFAGHLLYLDAGVAFLRDYAFAFVPLAIATAMLLLAGIRNAWDLALWIAAHRQNGPT